MLLVTDFFFLSETRFCCLIPSSLRLMSLLFPPPGGNPSKMMNTHYHISSSIPLSVFLIMPFFISLSFSILQKKYLIKITIAASKYQCGKGPFSPSFSSVDIACSHQPLNCHHLKTGKHHLNLESPDGGYILSRWRLLSKAIM